MSSRRACGARGARGGVRDRCSRSARPPFDLGPLALRRARPAVRRLARTAGRAARPAYAFVAGAVYYAILVSWTWYFGAIAIVPFVAALAAYWAAAGARRRLARDARHRAHRG